jgi:hypothetical protein
LAWQKRVHVQAANALESRFRGSAPSNKSGGCHATLFSGAVGSRLTIFGMIDGDCRLNES